MPFQAKDSIDTFPEKFQFVYRQLPCYIFVQRGIS